MDARRVAEIDGHRLLLFIIAGIVIGFLAAMAICFLVAPIPADAQDVGLFTTSSTGTRTNCQAISSPVAFQTWCLDQSGALNVYTGSSLGGWATLTVAPIIATQTLGVATSVPTCTNGCGTSPSVTGTMSSMRVTMGSTGTPRSPFLVLFGSTLANKPACIAQLDTATTTTVSVTNSSTTGVQVNTVIGPSQGGVFSIHCYGAQ